MLTLLLGKKKENDECNIKTNHPELLTTNANCNTWSTNHHYIQTHYFKANELVFMARLELAQPGYFGTIVVKFINNLSNLIS